MPKRNSSKQNRTFTIKTKLSVPDVLRKPTLLYENQSLYSSKVEKNKLNIGMNPNSKPGSFLKPKTYDVPSMVITSSYHE